MSVTRKWHLPLLLLYYTHNLTYTSSYSASYLCANTCSICTIFYIINQSIYLCSMYLTLGALMDFHNLASKYLPKYL